jgi:hypothetical protein
MEIRLLLPLLLSGVSLAQPAGSFIPTGAMTTRRWGHSATLLPNGKVLVAGGIAGGDSVDGTTELLEGY